MNTTTVFLNQLEEVIEQRLSAADDSSYTAQLASQGIKRVAQKVGEEAVELALASVAGSRQEKLDEAADLVYHLLVLLHVQDLSLADVAKTLAARHSPQDD